MLLFARPGMPPEAALEEYRRLNPWYADVSDAEIARGLASGDAAQCQAQLAELGSTLGLTLPIIDASGLPAEPTRRLLDALAPSETDI